MIHLCFVYKTILSEMRWALSSENVPSNMRKFADSDHPAHAQSIIRAFALGLSMHTVVSNESVSGQ